jgi:hypothetical protein
MKQKTEESMQCAMSDPFYPKITVFYVLDYRGNLVFSLLLGYINRIL